jgi:hypothetical protein
MKVAQNVVDFASDPCPQYSLLVDKLGLLNAQLSKLNAEAEIIKAQIKATGMTEIVGTMYRAVISTRDTMRLDSALVKGKLSPADIMACTKASRSVSVSLYDL